MKAHELLDRPEKWCQGAEARDPEGATDWDDPKAFQWCLIGALAKCYDDLHYSDAIKRVVEKTGQPPPSWNDYKFRTFEEVRTLLLELDL